MPRRTISLVSVKAHPVRKPQIEDVSLDDVRGADLLEAFETWATEADASRLTDYQRGRYVNISEVQRQGRVVTLIVKAGPFGEAGDTMNARTHEVVHERKLEEPATFVHRMMLIVPAGLTRGVFVIEHVGGNVSIRRLIDEFKRAMRDPFPGITFQTSAVLVPEAWLAGAQLREVRAIGYRRPVDVADGIEAQPSFTGKIQHVLQPEKGRRTLPSRILPALRNKTVSAAQLLGLPDDYAPDATMVTVENAGREKTFDVDTMGLPPVRVIIADDHDSMPTTPEFIDKALGEVRDFYEEMGIEWNEQWRHDPRPTKEMISPAVAVTVS